MCHALVETFRWNVSSRRTFSRMSKFVIFFLLLNACTLSTDPTPPPSIKIAHAETTTMLPTETATFTPTRTLTFTPTATRTATRTPTTTPSPTPTQTLTPDPYALPAALGGTRSLARRNVLNLQAPPALHISPALFGLNYWVPPFGEPVRRQLVPLNFVVLRRGGENIETDPWNWDELDRFILDARALNVEPLIQVPYTKSDPAFAAKVVRYVNAQKKYDVRFWSIGNEEDKNGRGGAREKWITEWRKFRDAMKAVDARILIFGPELAQAYDFTDPTNDWLTPFLRANGNAVDVVALHRYPFNGKQTNPTVLVGDALGTARRVRALRQHIQRVTGRDIPLAFTEINLSDNWREFGEGSGASFSAGLWMAETLGQMAEAGVVMVNLWNARSNDSLGLIARPAEVKRPTYFATQLYTNYGDRIVPLASHVTNVSAHAARDSRTGKVSIVLINRGRGPVKFDLDLNSNQELQTGAIYFDLSTRKKINFEMPASSMVSLSLDANLNLTRTFLYSRAMFDANQPPQVTP